MPVSLVCSSPMGRCNCAQAGEKLVGRCEGDQGFVTVQRLFVAGGREAELKALAGGFLFGIQQQFCGRVQHNKGFMQAALDAEGLVEGWHQTGVVAPRAAFEQGLRDQLSRAVASESGAAGESPI